MKLKHLLALALVAMGSSAWAQQAWTDVTSKITNPSFESDNAIADLTTCGWATDRATGWTILPESASNAQVGIGNSSSKIQGIGTSSNVAEGDKFFYVRQNWNNDPLFGIKQTISGDADNLPAGLYMLTCKIKTSSSNPGSSKWTLSIQEGENAAVSTDKAGSAAEWLNYGVIINKAEASTSLTISAVMKAGASGGSQHYVMMIDDVQLKYLSPSDIENLSPENTLDVSGVIYNAGIFNATKTALPRGWQEYGRSGGNDNRTENTGDTQLEGWSNGSFSRDYYQTIASLPGGKYRVTAYCHDSNDTGAYLYIYSVKSSERKTADMGKDYADITTESLSVEDGTNINIGIKGENIGATWLTGDNFRLEYLGSGIDLTAWNAAKADAETALGEYDEKYAATERAAVVAAKDAATPTTDEEVATKSADLKTKIATYRTKAANEKLMEDNKPLTDAIARIKTEYPNSSDEVLKTDLSKWTTSTYTVMNNKEHWSGAASYKYYEQSSAQWGQNSWSIYAEQTVNLPVGKYAFVVTVRAAAETTSKMTINGTEYELCHKGASGYGIATDGEATFDMAKTYANGNNGYGWEYAYAEFEITEAKDVTFRFDASTSTAHNWVSIADPVLYYNDDAKEAMELVRKNGIIALITDVLGEEDANVPTGKMNAEVATALADAVTAAKAGSTTNTVDELTGFKSALETAIANANTSVANYAKVAAINTKAAALDTDGQAAYAETLAAYNNGTLTAGSEEAQAKAAYIAAVKAQTSDNAVFTGALNNPSFEEGTSGWENRRNTTNYYDYSIKTENPADGEKLLNAWADQFNYSNVWQKVKLPAGTYTLSAKARTNEEVIYTRVCAYINNKQAAESENLVYSLNEGEKWNDMSAWKELSITFSILEETDVELGIYSNGRNLNGNHQGFFQVDDFQLIRVKDAETTYTRETTTEKYGTICLPYAASVEGATVYSASLNDDQTAVTLTEVENMVAGTPYIYQATADAQTFTYAGAPVPAPVAAAPLTGVFTATQVPVGSYVMQTQNGAQKFYIVAEGKQPTLSANKAYLTVPASEAKTLSIGFAEETAIKAIDALMSGDAKIYDLNGRELKSLQKGVNIVNGVKVLVK